MAHVVLGYRKAPNADVYVTWRDAPEGLFRLPWDDLRPWPHVQALAVENPPGAAKRASRLVALHAGMGQWILRRSLVAPIFAGVAGVTLRPIALADKTLKIVDRDFAYVDVQNWWPLDVGATLARPRWRRPPPARIFRVAEQPRLILADEPLAAASEAATRGSVGRFQDRDLPDGFFGPHFPDVERPLPHEPAAAEAFFAGDRAHALTSARYATWLARAVDGKSRPDTRRAALRDPRWSAVYAILVDRKPSPTAEKSATRDGLAAFLYAYHAAFAISPALAKTLLRDGWSDDDIVAGKRSLDQARRFLRDADRR
jgi:hypothetical protein